MNNLAIINQQEVLGKNFRIYGDKENPLFLAKDVAEWIENKNVSQMINVVNEEEKALYTMYRVDGSTHKQWFLTEDGVYEVLMQSRKPIAKAFKKEVKKILKQIRQTGGYIPTAQEDTEEELMAKAFLIAQKTIERQKQRLKEEEEKRKLAEQTIIEQAPLVNFAQQVSGSNDSIDVGTFAKLVKNENISIGRNKLFAWLRYHNYITERNIPYQAKVNQGILELKEYVLETSFGPKLKTQVLITGKGQIHLMKKLKAEFGMNDIWNR